MQVDQVAEVLDRRGPLTGSELAAELRASDLDTWRACSLAPEVRMVTMGRRYLRLDATIPGWARLSPSIGREFQTFTVVSLVAQQEASDRRVDELNDARRRINEEKSRLARREAEKVLGYVDRESRAAFTFLLAGDIAYGMAHREPRVESSTGRMVNGSDLDIVVVHDDEVDERAVVALDAAIMRTKWRLLSQPSYREEIDFIIKSLARAREQMEFASFSDAVASKIMLESEHLVGSPELAAQVRADLERAGVASRIEALTQQATEERERAVVRLRDPATTDSGVLDLFIPLEERSSSPGLM